LSLRLIFYENPSLVLTVSIVLVMSYFGYALYIFEREEQPEAFTYWISLYVALTCMLTGWATDTYDIYNPVTWWGKATCIATLVVGLCLFYMLIDFIHQRMRATRFQESALQWVEKYNLEHKQRVLAAVLIQTAFRQHRWAKNNFLYSSKNKNTAVQFAVKYMNTKRKFRKIQKKLYRLELDYIDSNEDERGEIELKQHIEKSIQKLKKSIIGDLKLK